MKLKSVRERLSLIAILVWLALLALVIVNAQTHAQTLPKAAAPLLEWGYASPIPPGVGFEVQRTDDPGAAWTTVALTTVLHHTDTSVIAGARYRYRVSALELSNPANKSVPSNEASYTVPVTLTVTAPTSVIIRVQP